MKRKGEAMKSLGPEVNVSGSKEPPKPPKPKICLSCIYRSPDGCCEKILESVCCQGSCTGMERLEVDASFGCNLWVEEKE
jgi:hypothetical protein